MRQTLLLCALIGFAIAVPAGNFHQEYSYQASSSSFKNNELQHRTDDQGYYKKDGDLEGRTKPRIDANSEHSEYVNPNLRGSLSSGYGDSTDMNSYGHLNAQSGISNYGTNQLAEGIASSDRIVGSRGYSGSSNYGSGTYGSSSYGSGAYGSNSYGSSGYHSASYGSTANIQSIIQRLQQDFERELQNQRWREAYSQAAYDRSEIERQLRQNLTERLNSELLSRYGQQTIRNGLSYSIADGQVESTANYNNQDLTNLRQQLENNLLNRLRTQYSQGYGTSGSSSRYESHSESRSNYGYTSSTVRPSYQTLYPSLPVYSTTHRTTHRNDYASSNYEIIDSNTRYTPVVHPESISTIASTVQSQLDNRLNQVLDNVYRQYFSSSASYQLTNHDALLNRIQNELRNNITYLLDDNLRRNYGSQTQRDGYFYTIGPNGEISSSHNYALTDLEQLKAQVERNLIEKLNRQFETYRTRYTSQSHSYNSQSNYGNYDSYGSTPRYVYTTPRSQYVSGIKGGANDQYGYVGGSRQSGYDMTSRTYGGGTSYGSSGGASYGSSGGTSYGSSGGTYSSGSGTYTSASMGQLQRQLQDDLSRQLQAAISRDSSSYSSSGSYSPQNYQSSLQHLTDELNRNVTRHLQQYSASASYSASGNYDQAQIDNLRSQLLSSLTRQLQQNLQQHFHSSSGYSSSSSSNYRPVRGFSNYLEGQYKSGGSVSIGEDCDHGRISGSRLKRSLYQPYRSQPLSYYQSSDYGHSSGYSHSYSHNGHYSHRTYHDVPQTSNNEQIGQEVDGQQEMDLGQEIEEIDFNPTHSVPSKPLKYQENTGQQIQEDEFQPLQIGRQNQELDVGQQTVDDDFGSLHLGSHNEGGQEMDNSDLTQQMEISQQSHSRPSNLEITNSQNSIGQQVEDSELLVGASAFSNPNIIAQHELHVQNGYNKLLIGQQHGSRFHNEPNDQVPSLHNEVGQQMDDTELSQNVEEFEPLQLGQQHEAHIGQVPDNSGFTQIGQQVDDTELSQNVEKFVPVQLGQQPETLIGQVADDSEFESNNFQSSRDQHIASSIGQTLQHEIGQEVEEIEIEPIHKSQDSSVQSKPNRESVVVNSNQITTLDYWNSHKWKSYQRRFIERSKKELITKLEAALQNKEIHSYDRNTILNELTANVTKEINSYDRNILTKSLGLTVDEIKGIKELLFEDLRKKLDEIQKPTGEVQSYEINQNVNFQKPTIPSDNLHLGQTPKIPRQHLQIVDGLYSHDGVRSNQGTSGLGQISLQNQHNLNQQQQTVSSNSFQMGQVEESDVQQLETNEDFNLHSGVQNIQKQAELNYSGTNQNHILQKPKIPSDNLQLAQRPENDGQQLEDFYPNSDAININTGIIGNHASPDSATSKPVSDWLLGSWSENQRRFVEQLYQKELSKFKILLSKGSLTNYNDYEFNRDVSQGIQSEFSNYNSYFLHNYLGFKDDDLKYISENILKNLRGQWTAHRPIGQSEQNLGQLSYTSQIPVQSYQTQQNSGMEQELENQQPFNGDSNNRLPQQNEEHRSDSQIVQDHFLGYIGAPKPNEMETSHSGVSSSQTLDFMQHSRTDSHHGGYTNHHSPRKPTKLLDSSGFISSQQNYGLNNDMFYSPTLHNVMNEENLIPTPGFENNTPPPVSQNQPQQPIPFDEGIGRVSIQQPTAPWFGLSEPSQIDRDSKKLGNQLRPEQTRPISLVIEQQNPNINYDNSNNKANGYSGLVAHTSYGSSTYNRRFGYNSVQSSESTTVLPVNNGHRLSYGVQEEVQQNFETTGDIGATDYGRARVVQQREPLASSHVNFGVKGYRKPVQTTFNDPSSVTTGIVIASTSSSTSKPEEVEEIFVPSSTQTTDENLPWWKRFGNKIKEGASDLKKKIVG